MVTRRCGSRRHGPRPRQVRVNQGITLELEPAYVGDDINSLEGDWVKVVPGDGLNCTYAENATDGG